MKKIADIFKRLVSPVSLVLLILASVSAVLLLIGRHSVAFAEWVTVKIGHPIRYALAALTDPIALSIGEILLRACPVILVAVIIVAAKRRGWMQRLRFLISLVSVLSLLFTGYVYTLGIGYHRENIASRMDIKSVNVTEENLYSTLVFLAERCSELAPELEFGESGASVNGSDLYSICEQVCLGYSRLAEDYPEMGLETFDSLAKPVEMSELMTQLQLLGVYSFFTGEANVNVHYPDYTLPFTVAHEFAHQRGISRENEANFIAHLVCIRSDDPYVRYSGYMNMFEYVASALAKTNKELVQTVYAELDAALIGEMKAYSKFYYDNKNEFLANLSDLVNDNYLKAQGTEGIVSYGLVVRLAVAYYSN